MMTSINADQIEFHYLEVDPLGEGSLGGGSLGERSFGEGCTPIRCASLGEDALREGSPGEDALGEGALGEGERRDGPREDARGAEARGAEARGAQERGEDVRGNGELREKLEKSLGLEPILYKDLSHAIVGAAIEVHRRIGPGMIERVYQNALARELAYRAIPFVAQAPISIVYRGAKVGEYLADFIVDDKIILEIKAVERYHPVHRAQVYSYLGASNLNLGLLINFDVPVLYRSITRIIRR